MNNKLLVYFLLLIYFVYLFLWLILNFSTTAFPDSYYNYYTDSYGIIAAVGGLIGLHFAKYWGGFASVFGKALSLFSIGLLFQFLGQLSYGIYHYVYNVEKPYPSFGEVFYFGSIPLYILAIYLLGKSIGSLYSLKSKLGILLVIIVPILTFSVAYLLFLSEYSFEDTTAVTAVLDIGYPVGQSIYLAGAVLALFLSVNVLGGRLKRYVLVILIALFLQYIADTFFLYQTYKDSWKEAGISDILFATAYTMMGMALALAGKQGDAISVVDKNQS